MALRKIETFTGPKGTVTVHRDAEWNEYRVKMVGQKGTGYHTDDKQDAMDTARSIAGVVAADKHAGNKLHAGGVASAVNNFNRIQQEAAERVAAEEKVKPMVIPPFKSLCLCGHTGDGAYSMHGGMIGHGPCSAEGCDCKKFTWHSFI